MKLWPDRISFLIFPEGGYWVAQCLEYDITTQAKNLRKIGKAIEYAVDGHIAVSKEIGVKPFESLPPAPEEFLKGTVGIG